MILGFSHPCLVVPDLERARTFYHYMFGFELISEESWSEEPDRGSAMGLEQSACRGCMMKGHNCFMELIEFSSPENTEHQSRYTNVNEPGIRHLAFFVDDCWLEYKRMQALGGIPMGVPAGDPEHGYAVYCRDPFGNIIELMEIPDPKGRPASLPGISRFGGQPNSRMGS